jgi:hypothetical protein
MPNKQCKPGGMYEHWKDDVDSFASPLIALGEFDDHVLSDVLLFHFLLSLCFTDIDLFIVL